MCNQLEVRDRKITIALCANQNIKGLLSKAVLFDFKRLINHLDIDQTNPTMKNPKMRLHSLFIALLTLLPGSLSHAAAPDCDIKEDPIWYACAKDKDCTLVYGACHHPVAIASKYKKPGAGFHACEAMRTNCAGTPSPTKKVTVSCVSKKCKISN
jgi:hypothetical protein